MNENSGMLLEEQNGVLVLSMNMAGNNLMTADFFKEYEAVMAEIEKKAAESSYKGLVIKGAGRHFSVGADVAALAERSASEPYDDTTGVLPGSHIKQKHFFTFLRELPVRKCHQHRAAVRDPEELLIVCGDEPDAVLMFVSFAHFCRLPSQTPWRIPRGRRPRWKA